MECLTAELAIKNSDRVEIFYHRDPASIWHTYSTSQAIDPPSTFATASLVFHHSQKNFDCYPALAPNLSPILPHHLAPPEALGQPVTAPPREEGSVSATLDQLSNQTDALMTIPPGKVASCREVFGNVADKKGSPHSSPQSTGSIESADDIKTPTRWPTHDSARTHSAPIFSTDKFFDSLSKEKGILKTHGTNDQAQIKTCEALFIEPKKTGEIIVAGKVQAPIHLSQSAHFQPVGNQSTPPSPSLLTPPQSLLSTLPPPDRQTRDKLGDPPLSPLEGRGGQGPNVKEIKPNFDTQPVGASGPESEGETPPRNPAALDCRRLPPLQQKELPTKRLGSPPGEVGTDHVSSQMILAKDEPSPNATIPDAKFFNSSDRYKSTSSPSKQYQNPWDLFGSPDEVKIYSALTCGLACGALVAVAVPSAPITVPAVIIGAGAGAVAGWSIASGSSNRVTKQNEP